MSREVHSEGLIWAVRDPIFKSEPIREKGRVTRYQKVRHDPGIDDKRLLVFEPEFGSVLRVIGRCNEPNCFAKHPGYVVHIRTTTARLPGSG